MVELNSTWWRRGNCIHADISRFTRVKKLGEQSIDEL
jgi:hypothetical protein